MKPGDKVRFLNDVGGGTIVSIKGKNVTVADADGFEIPMHASDVVVVNATDNNFPIKTFEHKSLEAEQKQPKAPQPPVAEVAATTATAPASARDEAGDSYELMLAFLTPKDDKTSLYLLNDSTYRVHYLAGMYERNGHVQPLAHGVIEPDSKELLKTISLSELREARTLRVQVALCKNISYKPYDLEPADVELNPLKFFKQGAFVENDFFDEKALIYRIFSSENEEKEKMANISAEEIQQAMMQKNVEQPKPQKPKPEPEIEEVDLHAEMLVPDPLKLQAGELLELQMARFTATLENALKSGRKGKIVFIHGIGSGKLKQELRNSLAKNYPKLAFQDASFKEYGYGATMVFL